MDRNAQANAILERHRKSFVEQTNRKNVMVRPDYYLKEQSIHANYPAPSSNYPDLETKIMQAVKGSGRILSNDIFKPFLKQREQQFRQINLQTDLGSKVTESVFLNRKMPTKIVNILNNLLNRFQEAEYKEVETKSFTTLFAELQNQEVLLVEKDELDKALGVMISIIDFHDKNVANRGQSAPPLTLRILKNTYRVCILLIALIGTANTPLVDRKLIIRDTVKRINASNEEAFLSNLLNEFASKYNLELDKYVLHDFTLGIERKTNRQLDEKLFEKEVERRAGLESKDREKKKSSKEAKQNRSIFKKKLMDILGNEMKTNIESLDLNRAQALKSLIDEALRDEMISNTNRFKIDGKILAVSSILKLVQSRLKALSEDTKEPITEGSEINPFD